MKTILLIATLFLSLSAFSQTADVDLTQHAAQVVAHLHDEMLDPASFVLDGVYVTKPNKRGKTSVCYEYRAHNSMGGYAEGRAVEDGDDHNRLSTYHSPDEYGHFPGYNVGWVAPCKSKNVDRELTSDVKVKAATLYTKTK